MPGGYTITGKPLQSLFGRQLHEHYVDRYRTADTAKDALIAGLATQQDVLDYQTATRSKIESALGPFPARTALNAQTTGTLVRSGYTVEKVLFESMPGWLVSANLYVPDAAVATPAPAVLVLCGHATDAKVSYQDYAQGLAKLGYVALCMDMVGGGERLQLVGTTPASEHKLFGAQLPLVGWGMAGLQAWDASRGIDYLISRPEVDPDHIGATGTSGGGTQTVMLAAMDSRVTMIAPSCWIATYLSNLESELFIDGEANSQATIGQGIDVDDLLLMHAPKPMVIIAQEKDFYQLPAVQKIHDRMVEYYTLLGANPATECVLFVDTTTHQLRKAGREAAYALFDHVSGSGFGSTEPSITLESEANLRVTAGGRVYDEPGAIDAAGVMSDLNTDAATVRGTPSGATLALRIRDTLRMPDYDAEDPGLVDASLRAAPPKFRVMPLESTWSNLGTGSTPAISPPNYPTPYGCRYGLETETNRVMAVLYMLASELWVSQIPAVTAGTEAILYVAHLSADRELSKNEREALITSTITANPGVAFFALDVRGVGELQPATGAYYSAVTTQGGSGDYHWAITSEAIGEPMLGGCVWDVLRAIDLLASRGYTDIHLMGRGWGSIPAALAAVLDSRVTNVTLKNALTRWHACAVAQMDQIVWPASRMPTDALLKFDLTDVYSQLIADKASFTNSTPWGAWGANPAGEF